MKVAISSFGPTLESEVDPRFGRSACFIVVDSETRAFQVVQNDMDLTQGAGVQAARTVIASGAQVLLTRNCGPNAHRTLSAGHVAVYTHATGTVAQALEAYLKGQLEQSQGPNVESHTGV